MLGGLGFDAGEMVGVTMLFEGSADQVSPSTHTHRYNNCQQHQNQNNNHRHPNHQERDEVNRKQIESRETKSLTMLFVRGSAHQEACCFLVVSAVKALQETRFFVR